MRYLKRGVAALAAAVVCSTAAAQFANNCGSAPTVSEGLYAFDLTTATNDFAGPCGDTEAAPDAWVRYVPTVSGPVIITTCGLSNGDTVLTALNGNCGAPVLQCNDDTCFVQSSLTFPVVAGSPYMIRIAGYGGMQPTGHVMISHPNDACADAMVVNAGVYSFDSTNATTDGSAPCVASSGRDIWYRFTAPGRGGFTASTCGGTALDTVLSAYSGACGSLQTIACNDQACGSQSSISIANMARGQSVLVRLAGYGGAAGFGTIRFSFDSADDCADAVDVSDGAYAFDNTQAANDGEISCGGSNDLWFRYHAPGYGWVDATTCGLTAIDTTLSAVDGCGGPTISCNDDTCGVQSFISTPVTGAAPALIRLAGWSGDRGTGQVRFTFRGYDNCANAYPVSEGVYPFDTRTATSDGPSVCGASGNNVWYSYSAEHLGRLSVTTCGLTSLDTVLTAFDACGGNAIGCNDDANCAGNGFASLISFDVQPGSTTRISLGGFGGARGAGQVRFEFIPCRVDFNDDGFVDFFDYDAYVLCFETGSCPPGRTADFNGDSFADFFDYDDFVAAFEAGC